MEVHNQQGLFWHIHSFSQAHSTRDEKSDIFHTNLKFALENFSHPTSEWIEGYEKLAKNGITLDFRAKFVDLVSENSKMCNLSY